MLHCGNANLKRQLFNSPDSHIYSFALFVLTFGYDNELFVASVVLVVAREECHSLLAGPTMPFVVWCSLLVASWRATQPPLLGAESNPLHEEASTPYNLGYLTVLHVHLPKCEEL
jgi:hypothetical protein